MIALEIITPEKVALKDEVDSVVLPAFAGEMGILSGHTHLLTQLSAGELRIEKDEKMNFFAVSGGFAEVHPDRVEVFAETAEMAEEIDVERAQLAEERAREKLSKVSSPQDITGAQAALRRALIRLHVSEKLSRTGRKQ